MCKSSFETRFSLYIFQCSGESRDDSLHGTVSSVDIGERTYFAWDNDYHP